MSADVIDFKTRRGRHPVITTSAAHDLLDAIIVPGVTARDFVAACAPRDVLADLYTGED